MPNIEKIENLFMKIVFKQKLTFEEATASFVCFGTKHGKYDL
jgi:hypothetical protein